MHTPPPRYRAKESEYRKACIGLAAAIRTFRDTNPADNAEATDKLRRWSMVVRSMECPADLPHLAEHGQHLAAIATAHVDGTPVPAFC